VGGAGAGPAERARPPPPVPPLRRGGLWGRRPRAQGPSPSLLLSSLGGCATHQCPRRCCPLGLVINQSLPKKCPCPQISPPRLEGRHSRPLWSELCHPPPPAPAPTPADGDGVPDGGAAGGLLGRGPPVPPPPRPQRPLPPGEGAPDPSVSRCHRCHQCDDDDDRDSYFRVAIPAHSIHVYTSQSIITSHFTFPPAEKGLGGVQPDPRSALASDYLEPSASPIMRPSRCPRPGGGPQPRAPAGDVPGLRRRLRTRTPHRLVSPSKSSMKVHGTSVFLVKCSNCVRSIVCSHQILPPFGCAVV